MHQYQKSSRQQTPMRKGMNMPATSHTRLRRGLLYLARTLWIIFALSNLT